jgi:hypothetical protein
MNEPISTSAASALYPIGTIDRICDRFEAAGPRLKSKIRAAQCSKACFLVGFWEQTRISMGWMPLAQSGVSVATCTSHLVLSRASRDAISSDHARGNGCGNRGHRLDDDGLHRGLVDARLTPESALRIASFYGLSRLD